MGVQLRGKAKTADRNHRIDLRGVASLPKNRITKEHKEGILTAEPVRSESAPGKAKKFPIYEEVGNRILIPKYLYFERFYKKETDVINFIEDVPEPYAYNFKGALYTEQMEGAQKMLKVLGKKRGVVGKGRCGTGKTVIGTYLMHRILGKHIVLVDQFAIAEQWVQECLAHLDNPYITFIMPMNKQRKILKKYPNLPTLRKREKIDTQGHIVIASAQTLMNLPKTTMLPFSMLIVDEAHTFSAPRFAKGIYRLSFKYSVSLTATDKRPDGLDWIFKDILGPTIVPLKGRRMEPVVSSIPITLSEEIQIGAHKYFWCSDFNKSRTFWSCKPCPKIGYCSTIAAATMRRDLKKVAFHEMWSRLTNDPFYNKVIIDVIRKLHKAGRNILVLAKFKDHLRLLRQGVIDKGVPETDTTLFFGGMDKDKCLAFPITFATFGVAYKALNARDKDAEVLAMPVSNVEQPAGRVEREVAGKFRPIIVDFIIRGAPMFLGQYRKRRKFYDKAGYDHVDSIAQALDLCGVV
jgi:hypothetical protein